MTTKHRVAIVADSSASLPATGSRPSYGVPMQLTVGGATYADGHDLTATEFYRLQRRSDELSTTAAPPPGAFAEAFRSAAGEAESVLCLTVSPRFSSTFDSATLAADEVREERPDTRIEVVDTESAAGGSGLVATAACRAVDAGADLDGAVAAIAAVIPRVFLVAYLDSLFYVWKSGRIPRIAYASSSLLGIKPVFEMHRGEVKSLARPRSAARAQRRLVDEMRRRAGDAPVHAAIVHADAAGLAAELQRTINAEIACVELYVSEFSPVMGAHTGPGLLGVAFWSEG